MHFPLDGTKGLAIQAFEENPFKLPVVAGVPEGHGAPALGEWIVSINGQNLLHHDDPYDRAVQLLSACGRDGATIMFMRSLYPGEDLADPLNVSATVFSGLAGDRSDGGMNSVPNDLSVQQTASRGKGSGLGTPKSLSNAARTFYSTRTSAANVRA